MTESVPVILDVDTGIDDALALALVVRSPRVELVAVTTVAGNVDVERATSNTLAVLDWLGATEVPVHRGASRPLVRPHRDATYLHATGGLGSAELPPSGRTIAADRGPAAIVRLATARPGELTMVCVGPLANLAIALNVEPRLPELLRAVVVMGGAFEVPGNVTPAAEFNVYVDPEAAEQVFAAPFPRLTVVVLDVSHRTALPRAVSEEVERGGGTDAATRLVVEVCRQAFTERGFAGFYLHDPLALAVALDPSLVAVRAVSVTVGSSGEERGRTRATGTGSVRVAHGVDAERFLTGFYRRLGLPEPDVQSGERGSAERLVGSHRTSESREGGS